MQNDIRATVTALEPPPPPAERAPARWPLILLALPAGVATWSGWVGLGEKTGFGVVKPFPGIFDGFQINTAITLPIGVETYAAYALGAWLTNSRRISPVTRRFAKWSAIGSLLLGMLGQIAYHLLETGGYTIAPVQVTTAVSCLPVLVLGMGAGLGHMIARDAHAVPDRDPVEALFDVPAVEVVDVGTAGAVQPPQAAANVPVVPVALPAQMSMLGPVPDPLYPTAAMRYASELGAGKIPALKRIKGDLRIGQDRAVKVRAYLGMLAGVTP